MAYPNLISLLEQTQPSEIRSLRQSHPGAAGILTSARELGEGAQTSPPREAIPQELPRDTRAALVKLVDVSTGSLKKEVEELAASIRQQMRLVTRVRFAGAIIAAVSGGLTAILQYATVSAQAVTTAGAVVSMLGGLTTLFADHFEKAPSGIRIASLEEYGKMTEMRGDVERIRMRIGRDNLVQIPDDELRAMLERLDGYSLQVIRLRFV